jgi:hypothetical protein
MDQPLWKVVQDVGGRTRTVFEGIKEDAERYINDHFPRVHVEPGSPNEPTPDATLVPPTDEGEVSQ